MPHCVICQREEDCTRHHLYPRTLHKRLKKNTCSSLLQETVPCCPPCHRTIHHMFTEKELAREFNTVCKLLADTRIRKWRAWIRTRPPGFRPRCRRPV